jgi:tetratricopeptide (TPR) repeat protein
MQKILFLGIFISQLTFAISSMDYPMVYDSYSLEEKGKISQAIAKMTEVYAKNTDDYFIHYRLGWLFSVDKKYKIAIDHYKQAAVKNTQALEPWLALSLLSVKLNEWQSAATYSEEIIKRNPDHYDGNLRYIMASIHLKDYANAIEKVDRILKSYPLDPIFLEQKAYSLAESGKTEAAKKAVMELILVSPSNVFAKTFMSTSK